MYHLRCTAGRSAAAAERSAAPKGRRRKKATVIREGHLNPARTRSAAAAERSAGRRQGQPRKPPAIRDGRLNPADTLPEACLKSMDLPPSEVADLEDITLPDNIPDMNSTSPFTDRFTEMPDGFMFPEEEKSLASFERHVEPTADGEPTVPEDITTGMVEVAIASLEEQESVKGEAHNAVDEEQEDERCGASSTSNQVKSSHSSVVHIPS
jgi:hypothetical protein